MIRAGGAKVSWDTDKKRWSVRIQVGEEVIKRPATGAPRDAAEDALRLMAVRTASDDGYEVDPAAVTILR